jgi:hypothetical protein
MSEMDENKEVVEEEVVAVSEEDNQNMEEQPVFYNPVSVLQMDEFLKWTAFIMVAATLASNLLSLNNLLKNVTLIITHTAEPNALVWVVTVILFIIIAGAGCAVYYFPLRALGKVLKILMELEYNSRGIKE